VGFASCFESALTEITLGGDGSARGGRRSRGGLAVVASDALGASWGRGARARLWMPRSQSGKCGRRLRALDVRVARSAL
jgi:hypothetical protein